MAQNENVAAIERAVQQMNSGNLEGYLEMYSDDLTLHGYPPEIQGKEGVSAFYGAFAKAIPDVDLTLEDVVAEGDKVAVRYRIRGTHQDELMGVPATGQRDRRRRAVVLPLRGRPRRGALAVAGRRDAADAAGRHAGPRLTAESRSVASVRLRLAAIWLVLFAVYASTIGLNAFGPSDYGGDEPHYLLTAKSLVDDRDVDVRNQRAAREWEEFYPQYLDRHGKLTDGRAHEPHGAGFPVLIAPAFAIGGAKAVELFLAAIAALGGVLAYLLALRVVPDPWAIGATLAVTLSPPFLAYGSAVYPELPAATALAGAALLALRLQEHITRPAAAGCFLLLGTLPWLGTKFVPAGVVIGVFAARTLWRARHRTLALLTAELALFSVVFYVTLNEALYDGPTPYSADDEGETATDASFPVGYLERAYRLVALFIDREVGLLRWAPVFALAGVGVWLLVRARRERLARAIPEHARAESAALLCALGLGAQLLVAAFLAPTMFGFSFPPRHLIAGLLLAVPLVAWGLRRFPRTGTVLALVGIVASVWLYADVRWGGGGLVLGRPDAPWGPLEDVLPLFEDGNDLAFAVAGGVAAVLVALCLLAWRNSRQSAGPTRAKYSG